MKPMIALPFHPSNAYEIDELNANLGDILRSVEVEAAKISGNPDINFSLTDKIVDGKLQITQGIIAGCAGGNYTNVMEAAHILNGEILRRGRVFPVRLSFLPARVHGSGEKGAVSQLDGGGRCP